MTSQYRKDLLWLLIAVIVADKRIFAEEIQRYLEQAAKLQITLNTESKWSEAKVLMFYELNKGTVAEEAEGQNLEKFLYEHVRRLSTVDNKAAILEAMRKIAVSDGEFHASEKASIILTARQWALHTTKAA